MLKILLSSPPMKPVVDAITAKGGSVASPQGISQVKDAVDSVSNWNANLIPNNILKGVSVWDKVGNVGRSASGVLGVVSAGASGTVSGLNFIPRLIHFYADSVTPGDVKYSGSSLLCQNSLGNTGWKARMVNNTAGYVCVDTQPTGNSFNWLNPSANNCNNVRWEVEE